MLSKLKIEPAERSVIFVDSPLTVETEDDPLLPSEIFKICSELSDGKPEQITEVNVEKFEEYSRKVRSMITDIEKPTWLRVSPEQELEQVLNSGSKSVLLFGPPRTGKTRIIDQIKQRNDPARETIQIHDGWGYDNLIQGLKPDQNGNWKWEDGPLKRAIESGKKFIVLEEINRTQITQSLGETFSLIEDAYRGVDHALTLRDGKPFFIPDDVIFVMTMNTIDKSTEEVDDALMGRISAIEFPPRAEDLNSMLSSLGLDSSVISKISEVYAQILEIYPLGHGYFSGLSPNTDATQFISYYKVRIRPVLNNFFGELKSHELDKIDNLVDQKFT